jgi:hypothetical protein
VVNAGAYMLQISANKQWIGTVDAPKSPWSVSQSASLPMDTYQWCVRFAKAGLQCSSNFSCPSGTAVPSTAKINTANNGGGNGAKSTSDNLLEANIVPISSPSTMYPCKISSNTGTTWSVTCNTPPTGAGTYQLIVRFQIDGMCQYTFTQ